MKLSSRLVLFVAALVAYSAEGADITGEWMATVVTAMGEKHHTYVFRQNGGRFIGTVKSPDGVASISNGYINYKTVTFTTNIAAEGGRVELEYTGELVSDKEIRFERRTAGASYPVVRFVATRAGTP